MVKIIRLSKSVIGNEEKIAVLKVLEKEFLGMGEEVDKFEKKLSKIFKRSTVCVSSGTSAIQLSLEACNIGENDEVLVPSLTYVATFQAIKATGAIPIPCDVDEDNLLIDIEDAKSKITNRTKAIIPVHYTGGVGDLNSLYEFAQKNKIRVIEDAAHAFGTIYNSNLIGSIGDIVCFSFDGIKNITSGEGGCIISNDKKIIERVQNSRLLGVENDSKSRYKNARSWDFNVKRQGWRYHMSNVMAAIGIEQLKKRDLFFSKRKLLAVKYDQLFENVKDISSLQRDYENVVPHIYVVRINNLDDRNTLKEELLKRGIQVGIHYKPNHKLEYFKTGEKIILPVTDRVYSEVISLPIHPDLDLKDIEYVAKTLIKILPKYLK